MVSVKALTASVHCASSPIAGAKVVASYKTTGDPVIVRAKVTGRNRVDVNVYPGDYMQPDIVRLLANALVYPSSP